MPSHPRPTLVLVHGAYADSASWNGCLPALTGSGARVLAFANPLRGLASDAALLEDLLRSVEGPVVLVGHSYGGAVMTQVPVHAADVRALVYVAAFALAAGESAAEASALVAGSTLADTWVRVPLADGRTDTWIDPARFTAQFAADVEPALASSMAVTQRPVTLEALSEPGGADPLWQRAPSWFVFGDADRNIPVGAHRIMAQRAGARRTVEIAGASHVVGISHPDEVAALVLEAAAV